MADIEIMRTDDVARQLASRALGDGRTSALVCTSDKGRAEAIASLAAGCRCNVEILEFDDVEAEGPSAFSARQANEAAGFLEAASALGKRIVVASDEGRSRSAAVVAAWLRANGESDIDYWLQPEKYAPNVRVYRLLAARCGVELLDDQVRRLRELKEAMPAYRAARAGGAAGPVALEGGEKREGRVSIRGFGKEYFFLSNLYEKAPCTVDGTEYRNPEAAYQAGRAKTLLEADAFTCLDPASARRLAHHGFPTRDGWGDARLERMRSAVRAKFFGNLDLAWRLVQTGDAELCNLGACEDEFWGRRPRRDGAKGQDNLGKILMEVRRELAESIAEGWPPRTHVLKIAGAPYEKVAASAKSVDLRLYDEKVKQFRPGDAVVFNHADGTKPPIHAIVTEIAVYPDFETLYEDVDLVKCGYTEEGPRNADPSDMDRYYPADEQRRYCACAIGFELAGDAVRALAERRRPSYPVEQLLYLDQYDESNPDPDAIYLMAFIREDEMVLHETPLSGARGGHAYTVDGERYVKLAGELGVSPDALAESSEGIADAILENFSCADGARRFVEFCDERGIAVSKWRF